jgi:hypothetical protein
MIKLSALLSDSLSSATHHIPHDAAARLEECASAAFGREMDAKAALAALLGPTSRFLLHRTTVILGRGGPANVRLSSQTHPRC